MKNSMPLLLSFNLFSYNNNIPHKLTVTYIYYDIFSENY